MDGFIKLYTDSIYLVYARFLIPILLFIFSVKVVVFLYNLCVGHGFAFITSGKFGFKRTDIYHNPDSKKE